MAPEKVYKDARTVNIFVEKELQEWHTEYARKHRTSFSRIVNELLQREKLRLESNIPQKNADGDSQSIACIGQLPVIKPDQIQIMDQRVSELIKQLPLLQTDKERAAAHANAKAWMGAINRTEDFNAEFHKSGLKFKTMIDEHFAVVTDKLPRKYIYG